MPIGDYCHRNVRTVMPEETVRAAAQRMKTELIGCLVAADDDRPVGVVTDRDIALHVLRENLDPDKLKVRDVMVSPVVTVPTSAPVDEALRVLRKAAVRRLVVVDGEGKVAGLFAADDLLRLVATELGDLGEALRVQLSGPRPPHRAGKESRHA